MIPQTAVLRFENLSSDVSLNWMGRGFAEVISTELQGSPQRYSIPFQSLHSYDAQLGTHVAGVPGISTELTGALVAGANQVVYGDFFVARGTIYASATAENLTTHRLMPTANASGPVSAGPIPVASALARQLGDSNPFGTGSTQALEDFVAGEEAPDVAAGGPSFAKAAADDPEFGHAYVFWLDAALGQRNRAEAEQILVEASAHRAHFSALTNAELDFAGARLRGDFKAQLDARRELARRDPADPNRHRALGEALMSIRAYDDAIVEFRRGLSVRQDDVTALNSMGYAAAYSGDLPTAIRVLRGYEHFRPNEPNPLDSLGDVHFALSHFKEAEQFYLAANAKAPRFLNGGEVLKAAQARLMTGDVPGATGLFKRYLAGREAMHDPNAAYQAAAWQWMTGSRPEALATMDRVARAAQGGPSREIAGRANAQAAIWMLSLGDQAGAAGHARRASGETGPATAPLIAMVAYLAQPDVYPAPEPGALRDYAQAYSLLLNKQFGRAAGVLQNLYRRPSSDLDDGLAVLLAWAYAEAGDWRRAEPLLRLTPLPQGSGFPMFESLYFPRLLSLRGAVLERSGHPDQAAQYKQLFQLLEGRR